MGKWYVSRQKFIFPCIFQVFYFGIRFWAHAKSLKLSLQNWLWTYAVISGWSGSHRLQRSEQEEKMLSFSIHRWCRNFSWRYIEVVMKREDYWFLEPVMQHPVGWNCNACVNLQNIFWQSIVQCLFSNCNCKPNGDSEVCVQVYIVSLRNSVYICETKALVNEVLLVQCPLNK